MKAAYFFCCPHGPAERAGYEHQLVCLAEGFRQLNIPFYSNVDYWQEGNAPEDFLIRHNPHVSFRDADIEYKYEFNPPSSSRSVQPQAPLSSGVHRLVGRSLDARVPR